MMPRTPRVPRFGILAAAAAAVLSCVTAAQAQVSLADTPLWSLTFGDNTATHPFMVAGDTSSRNLAFNPATGNIVLTSRSNGATINSNNSLGVFVLDGATGVLERSLNTTGISGGTIFLNGAAVSDDGAIYVHSLSTNTTATADPMKIYRYASEASGDVAGSNTAPTLVFSGDITGGDIDTTTNRLRFGDTVNSRGAGANFQMIMTSRNGQRLAKFAVSNPATGALSVTPALTGEAANDAGLGVAFGPGDTYFAKVNFKPLLHLDLNNPTRLDTAAADVGTMAQMAYDPTHKLVAFVSYQSGNPAAVPPVADNNQLRLYDASDLNNLVLLDTAPLPNPAALLPNINGTTGVDFGMLGDQLVIFALDSNNGIAAYPVLVPEPASLGLLGLGAAGLLARRRRA
jgi:hypothetical protein